MSRHYTAFVHMVQSLFISVRGLPDEVLLILNPMLSEPSLLEFAFPLLLARLAELNPEIQFSYGMLRDMGLAV